MFFKLAVQGMAGMFLKYSFMVKYVYLNYFGLATRKSLKTIPTGAGAQSNKLRERPGPPLELHDEFLPK